MKSPFKNSSCRRLAWLALACLTVGSTQSGQPLPKDEGEAPKAATASAPKGITTADWTGILAARHAIQRRADGSSSAANPRQQWNTVFDGRGFLATPHAGGWQWGLELQSYGFPGHEHAITQAVPGKAHENRLTYVWDAALEEWFVNDPRGLEHGFTVHRRPVGGEGGSLRFTLAVRGGLKPAVQADGQGVGFIDAQGGMVLTYAGLKVWDADGKALPSHFEPAGSGALCLNVDAVSAHYPLTIDPIAQQAYVKAFNTGGDDNFGLSVAISGNTAVVGAPLEDGGGVGVNPATNDLRVNAGAAYVFVRAANGTWSQQAYLKSSANNGHDQFGSSVAISGDTIVVGSVQEDVGYGTGASAPGSGSAYVFVRKGTTWSTQGYLKATNFGASDHFGRSVAISGNTVAVGAPDEDGGGTGINPATNEGSPDSGAVYIFTFSSGIWQQTAYLKAGVNTSGDSFGASCALDNDTLIVGAPNEDGAASNAGAAYVFQRSALGAWSQQAYLKASNPDNDDNFGDSVAVSGNTALVGAPYEDGSGKGVNPPANNSAGNAGAAYVFDRNGVTWNLTAYLKAGYAESTDRFGSSVAIDGDIAVVGVEVEDSGGSGIDPLHDVDGATDSGAAYVFCRNAAGWSQQAYLKAASPSNDDNFGHAVAVSGSTAIVGALYEDGSGTGVYSTPNENSNNAGAAYIFSGLGLPKMSVEQPAGSPVADGGSRDIGTAPRLGSKSLTFTIKNSGLGELSGLTTQLTGPDVACFTVTTAPAATVAPNGSTTFVVKFVPSRSGLHSATLQLPGNDAIHNPYVINLTATGTIPDIAVDQPLGTGLTDNGAPLNFGSVLAGTNTSLTFTIKNTGEGDLTDLTITKDGLNASEFILTKNPTAPVTAPIGSTTFVVKFAPAGIGARTAALHIASNDPDESPFDINLTGTGTAPEIGVAYNANDLVDGVSTVDFGSTLAGGRSDLVFTINNTGDGNLTGLAITKTGANASQFSVFANPTVPVAPANSTTVTIRFSPTNAGPKEAILHIASNDADENPFDLKVTGTGIAPVLPVVKTLAADSVTQTTAVLHGTVDAKGSSRNIFFDLGTTTAYAQELAASPASLDGAALGAVPVSLSLSGLLPHTKYNFRVLASGFYGTAAGANLVFTTTDNPPVANPDTFDVVPGAKAVLPIFINDLDPDGDTLSVASFTALSSKTAGTLAKVGNTLVFSAAANFSGPVTFSYTASDGFGMTSSAQVTLNTGTCGIDPVDKEVPSAGITYPVTVTATGFWSVVESLPWAAVSKVAGRDNDIVNVTLQPNASKNARSGSITIGGVVHHITQLGVVAPKVYPPSVPLAIVSGPYSQQIVTDGAPVTYTVTKMPPGLKISNDTGFITGTPTVAGDYDVTVKATNAQGSSSTSFTVHVQKLPDGIVGSFHGYLEREPVLNGGLGSRLELTIGLTGSFTGKVISGVTSQALTGALLADPADPKHPQIHLTIPRKTGLPLHFNAAFSADDDNLSGSLDDSTAAVAQAKGWRNTWNATTNKATAYSHLHTFSLEQADPSDALPQGYGFGSFTVKDTTGALTASGKLADGSSFTTVTFLGPDGQILIYQPLYANKGSLLGVLVLKGDNTIGPDGNILDWNKPAPLPTSKDTIYKDGFLPIPLVAEGASYIPPLKGEVVMGLTNQPDNADLDFSGGGLEEENEQFHIKFSLLNPSPTGLTNKATMPAANANKVNLPVVTPATGVISGDFTIPKIPASLNRKVTFQGLIVKHAAGSRGYGFFLLPELPPVGSGMTLATTPKHSGKAVLGPAVVGP